MTEEFERVLDEQFLTVATSPRIPKFPSALVGHMLHSMPFKYAIMLGISSSNVYGGNFVSELQ